MERVRTDHSARNLAGDGNKWDAIEQGISEAADKVGGAWAGGGNAHPREARGASVALRCKNSALLVAGKDVADDRGARQSLVNFHGGAARIGEDGVHTKALEGLDEDISAFTRRVGSKSGDERLWGGGRCFLDVSGECNGGVGEGVGDMKGDRGLAGCGAVVENVVREGNGKS